MASHYMDSISMLANKAESQNPETNGIKELQMQSTEKSIRNQA